MATAFAALAGCGGDTRLSREEFSGRLTSIKQRESGRFERLARQVNDLKPDENLPADVKQAMTDVAAGHRRTADELSRLDPPEAAEAPTAELIAALRQRADAFTAAARKNQITLRQVEEDGAITSAGDRIDRAFERLAREGLLRRAP